MRNQVLFGDALEVLRSVPNSFVQCVVTSPPFWGLREYGDGDKNRKWFDGDPSCDHNKDIVHEPHHPGQVEETKWQGAEAAGKGQTAVTNSCSKCGAWYGQFGLEPDLDGYLRHLTDIFAQVHRVLRDDGILWINIGDTFKNKRLMGVPWNAAFRLQEIGFKLRSEVLWVKDNAKPESVKDRPVRCHEHVFMLTKSDDYFYNYRAVQKEGVSGEPRRLRDVWTLNYEPFRSAIVDGKREAHFAVFPPSLPRTCIKASTSPFGSCEKCGTSWSNEGSPRCPCEDARAVPSIVLDPFAGSGTTLGVARSLGQSFLGIEACEDYKTLIQRRIDDLGDQSLDRVFQDLENAGWNLTSEDHDAGSRGKAGK